MSPSEFDLRAALREGQGEGLDVDRIVAGGQARRGQRRTQLLSTTAAVVFVAAASVGGAVLIGNAGSGNPAGGGQGISTGPQDRNGAQAPAPSEAASSSKASLPARIGGNADQDSGPACPTSFPHTLLPGGGSPGQFGSDGPMFAQPVGSIVVCSFGAPAQTGSPARLVLTGGNATALARSLENAPKTRTSGTACVPVGAGHRLAIIGVTAGGTPLPTVTTTLNDPPCNVQVTNGTAVRYDWKPPSNLARILVTLTPTKANLPTNRPSSKNVGSPIHS